MVLVIFLVKGLILEYLRVELQFPASWKSRRERERTQKVILCDY